MTATVPVGQALDQAREIEELRAHARIYVAVIVDEDNEIQALKAEVALLRTAHDRADGALADAATVPTGDLERGIRELTADRDVLAAEVAAVLRRAEGAEAEWQAAVTDRDDARSHNQTLARAYERQENRALAAEADVKALTAEQHRLESNVAYLANRMDYWMERARAAEANVKALAEALADIVALSAGWDADGSTGPRSPLSWESVGCMAMDYAAAALSRDGVRRGREEGTTR